MQSTPYRAGSKQRKLEHKEIEKICEANVVELSVTKLDASVVFAPNEDGSRRLRVHDRRLNEVTEQNS